MMLPVFFCYPDPYLDPVHEADPDRGVRNEMSQTGSGSATLDAWI